jgi:membrane-anchored glycerophosphoryl diester phosphodiesterase (GDPDase)
MIVVIASEDLEHIMYLIFHTISIRGLEDEVKLILQLFGGLQIDDLNIVTIITFKTELNNLWMTLFVFVLTGPYRNAVMD